MFRKTITLYALLTIVGWNTNTVMAAETEVQGVRFERHIFTVERHRGVVRFDGVAAKHATTDYPLYVALITAFDGIALDSDRDVLNWVRKLHGPRTFTYDNVIRTDDQGNEVVTPLVLLPADERSQIDPLWSRWVAEELELDRITEQKRLAYESERSHYQTQQEAASQIVTATQAAADSLAIASGETSLWEVELVPQGSGIIHVYANSIGFSNDYVGYTPTGGIGSFGVANDNFVSRQRRFVRVYGRSSSEASSQAISDNPGLHVGSIRKLAGY